jgi:hypothetical protein
MIGGPLRRRLATLEAAALQRNRFVVFVQTDQSDERALRAQAAAEGFDPARLPFGTVLARARLTPAEAVAQAARAEGEADACRDPTIPEADHAAVMAVDTVHVAADSTALWFPDLLGFRQIVRRGGVLMAYAETLQALLFDGIAKSPPGGSVRGLAFRDATPEQRRAMIEQFQRETAGTLRPLAEAL